jgi:ubiquinone/menaquinone biosynthesis C-methylase UbiE
MAAQIVGPTGSVIGVDQSAEAVALASQRAEAAGLDHVRFITADLSEFTLAEPVDALVGRLVLMYFADPAVVLRRLAGLVKRNGLVIFHEMDLPATKSWPTCPLFELANQRIQQTFSRAGADIQTGLKLNRIFQEAGLPAPQMLQAARVESGPASAAYSQITQITRTLLPLMARTGVATAAEVEVDTLADRLRAAAVAQNATLLAPPFIGAWTRKG